MVLYGRALDSVVVPGTNSIQKQALILLLKQISSTNSKRFFFIYSFSTIENEALGK